MADITVDRIISMTELQKLSLRKLREMRLAESPLVVRDVRRGRSRFVILDHQTYERLAGSRSVPADPVPCFEDVNFADRGLFWDRPTMANDDFTAILGDPEHPEYRWAWARVLERLPSRIITRAVGLTALRRLVSEVKLRSRIRDAWEGALAFWTGEAQRRLG